MKPLIEQMVELRAAGKPFIAVTVVDAVGSTPAQAGSLMIVTTTGLWGGTVGGGKIEARALDEARKMLSQQAGGATNFIDWNLQRDIGMTCGGAVKLYFEKHDVATWDVWIFGAGHVSQALVRTLLNLECKITCVESRPEWIARLPESVKLIPIRTDHPCEQVLNIPSGASVVVMTMGHATDAPILRELLLRDNLAMVGVIGSAAKRRVLQKEMLDAGISTEKFESVHCPVGLKIGTNQPYEIAISIAAQLLMVRDKAAIK